ncbi:MAG: type VI secretion system lipoprotein TssJ [Desulfarculales bacterium]|jgi:type VI secretion system protein VasD|nr:type VI secretion system lipoprotein TssJ [Desulfarculales bacterium]
MKTVSLFLCLMACILVGAGCSSPRFDIEIASQPNLNPDNSGRPSPVLIKVYELSSDLSFKQADFLAMFEKPVQTLGSDLIAADELILLPGEAKIIAYEPTERTHFVGLLAGFRQIERAQWRALVAIDPEKANRICIELNDTAISLVPMEAVDDWNPEQAVKNFQQQLRDVNSNIQKNPNLPSGSEDKIGGRILPEQVLDESESSAVSNIVETTEHILNEDQYVLPSANRLPAQ